MLDGLEGTVTWTGDGLKEMVSSQLIRQNFKGSLGHSYLIFGYSDPASSLFGGVSGW